MERFPSPHSGILFLSPYGNGVKLDAVGIVSVPSFGDSFFIEVVVDDSSCGDCFRPLIRGFFFYALLMESLPFPHICFRPLIRGFFFYPVVMICRQV